jgi:hypothetical protein
MWGLTLRAANVWNWIFPTGQKCLGGNITAESIMRVKSFDDTCSNFLKSKE